MDGQFSQKLPVMVLSAYTSQFDKDFMKNYNENSDEGYFLEVDVQYSEVI